MSSSLLAAIFAPVIINKVMGCYKKTFSTVPAESTGDLLKYHIQIAKVPLCLLVAFSALFGFFLAPTHKYGDGLLTFIAVFLLACGAASLNSLQEHQVDRLLLRTRERPIARGVIAPQHALLQAAMLLGAGFAILYGGYPSLGPLAVGVAAVILYNFIYTPLKHKTAWALVPGAICGALPPYIGWLAGAGSVVSPVILTVAALLVVWQIPHFWLVVLVNKADYLSSSLPSLIKLLPERSLRLVSLVWVGALVTIIHVLLVLPMLLPVSIKWIVSISSFIVLAVFVLQMGFRTNPAYRFLFILLNGFIFLVMLLLSIGCIMI